VADVTSPKARGIVIRTWTEQHATHAWRATVTDVETRQTRAFSRFADLVRYLETVLATQGEEKGKP
jgi:environmental stress-induced protein Ves